MFQTFKRPGLGGGGEKGLIIFLLHCNICRFAIFLSHSWMSLTKHSLAWNNLTIPGQGDFG
jgi:hypothetical protein